MAKHMLDDDEMLKKGLVGKGLNLHVIPTNELLADDKTTPITELTHAAGIKLEGIIILWSKKSNVWQSLQVLSFCYVPAKLLIRLHRFHIDIDT